MGRVVAAGVAAVLAAGGVSCGGSDEARIRSAIDDVQAAFEDGDLAGVCDSMTDAARMHVRSIGHKSKGSCARSLRTVYAAIAKERRRPRATEREVLAVEVDGDEASATVSFGGGSKGTVPLAKEGDEWKVDGLYGGLPADRQSDKF